MSVYFDSKLVATENSPESVPISVAKGIFSYAFVSDKGKWYTVILYDKTLKYVHYLAMNVDGEDPNKHYVVLDYEQPKVTNTTREFNLLIYEQPDIINEIEKIQSRSSFNV